MGVYVFTFCVFNLSISPFFPPPSLFPLSFPTPTPPPPEQSLLTLQFMRLIYACAAGNPSLWYAKLVRKDPLRRDVCMFLFPNSISLLFPPLYA